MKKPLKTVDILTDNAEDNTVLSLINQKSVETIPKGSTPKQVEAGASLPNNVGGDDMVQPLPKGKAVYYCRKCHSEEDGHGNSEPC